MQTNKWNFLFVFVLLTVAGVWTACGRNEPPAESATAAEEAAVPSTSSGLEFTAPSEWTAETPASSMRKAQYRLSRAEGDSEDAEMAVFFFQGQGGSAQANVDRWIGQFKKPEGSSARDEAKVSDKEVRGIHLTIVDISGTYTAAMGPMAATSEPKPNYRMIAAIAETESGPWFFKLTGPAKTVAKWESSFHSFLETLRPAG